MNDSFLTRKELASALKVSLSTVDRGRKNKLYPFSTGVKAGIRGVRFPASIIDELQNKDKIAENNKDSNVSLRSY
jgi:predicted DNA-binding transcriptional regulator AlpA